MLSSKLLSLPVKGKAKAKEKEKAEKKAGKKPEKKSKPGVFARIGQWFKETKAELKKVQWPTRKQTVNNTLIVIACVVVVGICIALFDFVAGEAIRLLIGAVKG